MNIYSDSDSDSSLDCFEYSKVPHIFPKRKRVLCLGDLHGDEETTLKILKFAKIINDDLEWIAKPNDTLVIQVGDQLDSCRKNCIKNSIYDKNKKGDTYLFELFGKINKSALKKNGGGVVSLLGNHELMNVDGDIRYTNMNDIKYSTKYADDYIDELSSDEAIEKRKELFSKGNKYSKYLACTRKTAVIVGSNLFVHAGILPELAKKYKVRDLNILIKKWLLNKINIDSEDRNIGTLRDILYNSDKSPFWLRTFGKIPENVSLDDPICHKYINPVLQSWNVNKMIIGHTPTFLSNNMLNGTCNNKLWRIDTGLAEQFNNNNKQVLEILNDNEFNILGLKKDKLVKLN